MGKVQELFDKVAEKNPQKALELLLKLSEFTNVSAIIFTLLGAFYYQCSIKYLPNKFSPFVLTFFQCPVI